MAVLDLKRKLAILADAAKYDASCASSGAAKKDSMDGKGVGSTGPGMGICHAYAPDGRCISLLKLLLTNFCIYDCVYCVNRASSNTPRARFSVDEVVDLTLGFYKRNYIEGLFLSSGIIRNADYTMEAMVRVVRTLRETHDFSGYIHLKLIPEASPELVAQAGLYADRVSINIELPRDESLAAFAPEKDVVGIKRAMGRVRLAIDERKDAAKARLKPPKFAGAGQSSQLIVGADGASDGDILARSQSLYGGYGLKRVYYSAFSPIPDASARLPLVRPPLIREHRLYQADWLMRFYGFEREEIAAEGDMLDLEIDPKLAWALRHRESFPVDVNRAEREALLRVPGLGVKSVDRLIGVRRFKRLVLDDIARLCRGGMAKIKPFIVADDWTPGASTDAVDLRARLPKEPEPAAAEPVLMPVIHLASEIDFDGWRDAARGLRGQEIAPDRVAWRVGGDLFSDPAVSAPTPGDGARFSVPKDFVDLAEAAICHRDADRFDLLYRILWRLRDEPNLLRIITDPDVARAREMAKNVGRASHKMKAFVRFREIEDEAGETYIAWFEPAHRVLERTAGFFVRRFASLRFSILTPDSCAHWDGIALRFSPGADKSAAPTQDELEDFWRTYYASIFNPARLKVKAMTAEMPRKYWRNLPEASLIPGLIAQANERSESMVQAAPRRPQERRPRGGPCANFGAGGGRAGKPLRHCRNDPDLPALRSLA